MTISPVLTTSDCETILHCLIFETEGVTVAHKVMTAKIAVLILMIVGTMTSKRIKPAVTKESEDRSRPVPRNTTLCGTGRIRLEPR